MMMDNRLQSTPLLKYLIPFLGIFSLSYLGSYAIMGLAAPGHYYSPFIAHYFDYIAWLRMSLLAGVKFIVQLFGFEAYPKSINSLGIKNGGGIHVGYSCLGLGVMSFWLAFILANSSCWRIKLIWSLLGLAAIWMINVIRLTLVLLAHHLKWVSVFGFDHHSWFNLVTYLFIFFGMYLYAKRDALKKVDATA